MKTIRELFFGSQAREVPAACQTDAGSQQQPAGVGQGASYGDHGVYIGGSDITGSLTISAWHRGIELRANTMSQLTMEYQRLDSRNGNYIRNELTPGSAHLNYLMQVRPNPLMSWAVFVRQAEENRILTGNAVIYLERRMGEVTNMWLCNLATYNLVDNTYFISYYSMTGFVSIPDVPARDIIHLRNSYTEYNGLVGIPTLRYASRSLSIAATNDAETLSNAGKGGKLKLLLQEEKSQSFGLGRVSKDQLEKITSKLNQDIYNQDVVMLSNVAGVTPISQSAQQMEMLESRKFSVSDIARFLSVPKSLLMDDSGSSYKSPEASTQELLCRTIAPMIAEWEAEFTDKLIGEPGYGILRCHMCTAPLLRLDMKAQADIDKLHLEMGVASPNDIRKSLNLPSIKDGDLYYVSTNLAVVGSEKLKGGAAS